MISSGVSQRGTAGILPARAALARQRNQESKRQSTTRITRPPDGMLATRISAIATTMSATQRQGPPTTWVLRHGSACKSVDRTAIENDAAGARAIGPRRPRAACVVARWRDRACRARVSRRPRCADRAGSGHRRSHRRCAIGLYRRRGRTAWATEERTASNGAQRRHSRRSSASCRSSVTCSTPLGKPINATWRCCANTPPCPHRAHAQSRLVVGAWLLALFAVAAGFAILAYAVLRWLWLAMQ